MDLIDVIKAEENKSYLLKALRANLKEYFPEIVKNGTNVPDIELKSFAAYVIGFLELKEKGGDNE